MSHTVFFSCSVLFCSRMATAGLLHLDSKWTLYIGIGLEGPLISNSISKGFRRRRRKKVKLFERFQDILTLYLQEKKQKKKQKKQDNNPLILMLELTTAGHDDGRSLFFFPVLF